MVQFSGTISDTTEVENAEVTIFGGASALTATDAEGDYTVMTSDAVLSLVYGYAVDELLDSTDRVEASISKVAPAISLTINSLTPNAVTVTGTVADLDPAGRPVSFNGAAIGSALTDVNSDFSFTAYVAGPGTISASTMDLWGQSSNVAEVSIYELPAASSSMISLYAQVLPGHIVQLTGRVLADQPEGFTVTFGGAAAGTTTTDAFGNFEFLTNEGSLGTVFASASTEEWLGGGTSGVSEQQDATDTAYAVISVKDPVLSLYISEMYEDSITLVGTLNDVDLEGQEILIGGVAQGAAFTDATGSFTVTVDAQALGAIDAIMSNQWGVFTNTATVTLTEFVQDPTRIYTVDTPAGNVNGFGRQGSLAYVIGQVNLTNDEIRNVVRFHDRVRGRIELAQQLSITKSVRIEGRADAQGNPLIDLAKPASQNFRIIDTAVDITVRMSSLTIRDGSGGISNRATMTLDGVWVTRNVGLVLDFLGGGISNYPSGTLTLDHSWVTRNTVQRNGGGIANLGTLVVQNGTQINYN